MLKLNHNDFTGFPQALPPSLEQLYLQNNEDLGGTLPPQQQLKHLRRLTILWASSCSLTGGLPYSIGCVDCWVGGFVAGFVALWLAGWRAG